MICNSCNEDIIDDDALNCSNCKEFYHFNCTAMTEVNFRKMSKANRLKWSCLKCKFDKTDKIINTTTADYNLRDLTDSVNFMSNKFDNFGEQIKDVLSALKEIREENKVLKEQNINLKSEISSLGNRINLLEQKAVENVIEIIGVPEMNDEVCVKTVEKIVTKLGVNTSIINAYRSQSKFTDKPRKIIAVLSSKHLKNDIIANSRKMKLNGNMVFEEWKKDSIYVNNFLTHYNRNLFFKTKSFAREAGFKFVWFKDSKLFIKKDVNCKPIIIENESSLSLL